MSREREGRRGRRARTREERRLTQQQRRRPLLTKSKAFILAGLLALAGGAGYVATEGGKHFPRIISGEIQKSDDQIIREEIQRLGIKKSQEEIDLWRKNSFVAPSTPYAIKEDEITFRAFDERIKRALFLMGQSKNPYFKEAIDFIKPLGRTGDLKIKMITEDINKERQGLIAPFSSTAEIYGGRIRFFIDASANEVVNHSDSLTLAIRLVHEIEHIRNQYIYDQPFQFLRPEERISRLERHFTQYSEWIAEEGRGYAKQAQAFIYQAGLYGDYPKGSDAQLAAFFIRSGKNPLSPTWRSYLIEKHELESRYQIQRQKD